MNIRRFKLVNSDGVEYDLTTRKHFLHTPAGLGFVRDTVYQKLGNMHVVLDDSFEQGKITGDVFFPHPNAYNKYFEFVRFCQNTPLYLRYKPSHIEYEREVRVAELEKTELTVGGLNCPVVLDCLSLFYEKKLIGADAVIGESGKTYNYQYNYRYSASAANTVEVTSDSYTDSPCCVYIYGYAVNPTWRHYVNNILVGTGGVSGTIQAGQKLAIDTTKTPYSINRLDGLNRIVADMYAASDFSTKRFVFLKHGANRISISHDGANAVKVTMEAHILYASV